MEASTAPIYLDHNATTPVLESVRDAMLPWLGAQFGNPSSGHAHGRRAAAAVEVAREQVAGLIGADARQIVFTGGGTEADNIAVRTSAAPRRRIVTSAIEHPAVEEPARALREQGWSWGRLPVDASGRVDLDAARAILDTPTGLLSVILAQNETGVVQPVQALADLARSAAEDVIVHSDGAQAVGKIPVDVQRLGVDLLTIVSHKLYGPCGVGALYVRRPGLVHGWSVGGGQEQGIRPGTEPTAMLVGFGEACRVARLQLHSESKRLAELRDDMARLLCAGVPGLVVTGQGVERLPNTLHVRFPDVDGRELLARVPELAASTGSACHSADGEAAGVLSAMGVARAQARGAVRLSLGRRTTDKDAERAARLLVQKWEALVSRSS